MLKNFKNFPTKTKVLLCAAAGLCVLVVVLWIVVFATGGVQNPF